MTSDGDTVHSALTGSRAHKRRMPHPPRSLRSEQWSFAVTGQLEIPGHTGHRLDCHRPATEGDDVRGRPVDSREQQRTYDEPFTNSTRHGSSTGVSVSLLSVVTNGSPSRAASATYSAS